MNRSDENAPKRNAPHYIARFDKDGVLTIDPDTPETRADLAQTLHDFHSGNYDVDEERSHWADRNELP